MTFRYLRSSYAIKKIYNGASKCHMAISPPPSPMEECYEHICKPSDLIPYDNINGVQGLSAKP
jgi:hypothetical protein